MIETIRLEVNTVIGTGDPFDRIMLIPLISQWKVPTNCVWNLKEPCDNRISRLYSLREPVNGHGIVGICEEHHTVVGGETDDE